MAYLAGDIITRALRALSILQPNGVPSAYQISHGTDAFNDMMNAFTSRGMNISPTVPLPDQHGPNLIAILAVEYLAPAYGQAAIVPAPLVKRAEDGWSSLYASYVFAPDAVFEWSVRDVPSQRLLVPLTLSPTDFIQGSQPSSAPSVTGFCTLSAGNPTTVVANASCLLSSSITLSPYTQNAQAEMDSFPPAVAAGPLAGQFTITHQNNQLPDRIFEYKIVI